MKRLLSQGSSGSSGHQDEGHSQEGSDVVMSDSESWCVATQSEHCTSRSPDCSNDVISPDLTLHQPTQHTSSAFAVSQGDIAAAPDSQLSFESTVDTIPPASPADPVDSASVLMLALVPLVPQGDGDAAGGPSVPMDDSNNGSDSGDDEEDDDDEATQAMDADQDHFETHSGEANGANMFGFHHCDACVPFATCDVCHHVLRTRRLLHNDDGNFAEHVYRAGAHGLHICTRCHLVGMCDVCRFMLRDERTRPLSGSGRPT